MKDNEQDIVGDWAEDYAYLLKGATLMFFHKRPPRSYTDISTHNKKPVILVPGILGTWAFMKRLGDKLSSAGHPVYVVPGLGYNLEDIPTSAEKLKKVVERISKKEISENVTDEKDREIVIVGHSKGGLVAKQFLTHYNDDNKVVGVIAIATPFSGSDMAKLILDEPFQELTKESDIINEMKKHASVNSKIISIIPEFDNHVWAEEGSYLEGAENIKVPVRGHHKILFDEGVENIVLEKIESF